MVTRLSVLFMALCCMAGVTAFAESQDSPKGEIFYTQGKALLKKADFDGAFQAFSRAAKADPENQEYEQQAMMVRRAQTLRKFVTESEVSPQWEKVVVSLHAFYLTHEIFGEAVTMNRLAHKKMNNTLSASLLAESLLEAGDNEEALVFLNGLGKDKVIEQSRIFLGIALARVGRVEEATAARKEIAVTSDTHMGKLYDLARLDTLIGNREGACLLLTACFEQTLPSRLADLKGIAIRCKDFKTLRGTPAFAAAMKTRSKMTESSCSSGTSCGSCPDKAACGSEAEAETHGCTGCEDSNNCENSGSCENSESCEKSSEGCDKSSGCEKK